jgi:hypothetical protein
MRVLRPLLSAVVLATLSVSASAQEPSFEALGQAPVVAGDRVRARERALDEALRQAVEQAAGTVLTPDELVARSSDLKLHVYPKARTYVTNYRVLDEGEVQPGVFQVHLSVQVATGRLARDLAAPQPMSGLPRLPTKLRAVACVQAGEPKSALAGDKVVRDVLAARNIEVMAVPDGCSEPAAANAARSGAAQGAVVGVVDAQPAGDIRGTEQVGAHARAKVKLVEPDGRVSAEGEGERDAYATTPPRAAEAASREAVEEAARVIQPAMGRLWSAAAANAGGVSVRLTGLQHWSDYQSVVRALQALPGVAAVEPRKFSRSQAELLVKTASPAPQLAQGLQRVPPQGVRVTVRPTPDGALSIDVAPADGSPYPERG